MIMEYVIERNLTQRGLCNVKSIQTHLLTKTDIFLMNTWCGTRSPSVWFSSTELLSRDVSYSVKSGLMRVSNSAAKQTWR